MECEGGREKREGGLEKLEREERCEVCGDGCSHTMLVAKQKAAQLTDCNPLWGKAVLKLI